MGLGANSTAKEVMADKLPFLALVPQSWHLGFFFNVFQSLVKRTRSCRITQVAKQKIRNSGRTTLLCFNRVTEKRPEQPLEGENPNRRNRQKRPQGAVLEAWLTLQKL